MQHRFCVEAIGQTLRDIGNKEKPFGGIVVVLGGYFKHMLPGLHQNIRSDALKPENVYFAKFLVEVGDSPKEVVEFPQSVNRCKDMRGLITSIYPWLGTNKRVSLERFTEPIVLSSRTEDA
ncbi:hypothetical protein MKW98_003294 [Papaver atlanticum]|uniref:ATP-dependent DNA helicase n=1 Tax=Papaver atlanticum TaxID=357466 RepID=A0AAD4TCD2_9MAGN|nr:hypothetical protein MKW98_003294 [Papaver atlanticum]